jgi:hypothetical protein
MFEMHRIFCATPWELEKERSRFHDLIGAFNESHGLARGVLLVPVSLVSIRDKRPVQYAVDDNILQCRHYLLVHTGNWGPPERNFREDYDLAVRSIEDAESPMQSVAVLAKAVSTPPAEEMPEPYAVYSKPDEFDTAVNRLLSRWFESIVAQQASAAAAR